MYVGVTASLPDHQVDLAHESGDGVRDGGTAALTSSTVGSSGLHCRSWKSALAEVDPVSPPPRGRGKFKRAVSQSRNFRVNNPEHQKRLVARKLEPIGAR